MRCGSPSNICCRGTGISIIAGSRSGDDHDLQSADIVLPTLDARETLLRRITEPTDEQGLLLHSASRGRASVKEISNVVQTLQLPVLIRKDLPRCGAFIRLNHHGATHTLTSSDAEWPAATLTDGARAISTRSASA